MTSPAATPDITYHLTWCHLNYETPPVSSDIICHLTRHHPSSQLTLPCLESSISLPDIPSHLMRFNLSCLPHYVTSHVISADITCHPTWHHLSSYSAPPVSSVTLFDITCHLCWHHLSSQLTSSVTLPDTTCHFMQLHLSHLPLCDITCHLRWHHLSPSVTLPDITCQIRCMWIRWEDRWCQVKCQVMSGKTSQVMPLEMTGDVK